MGSFFAPPSRRPGALRALPLLVAVAALACNGPGGPPLESPAPETSVTPTNPDASDRFVQGPPLAPRADLLAWLEGDGEGALLQIPVVVHLSPLGIDSAHIGAQADAPRDDAVRLKLDDTALGISLAERLREHCSDGDPCIVWLEGQWGATVSGPGPDFAFPGADDAPEKHPFSVRKVVGPVTGAPTHLRVASG